MEKTCKIIRRSIFTFLQNYHHFSSTAALLAFPFSASVLLSQVALLPSSSSSLLHTIYSRLHGLFTAAGFPPSSELFAILNQKLAQTIASSVFTLPFTLTFFLISKSFVIQILRNSNPYPKSNPNPQSSPSISSVFAIFSPVFLTYLCNSLLILSANATVFALLVFAFNLLESLGLRSPNAVLFLSAAGAVLYSIILANALVICNLGLVLAGMEGSGGYLATLKAFVLIRGRASTALSLALPVNLALAAIEALFQYRVVGAFHEFGELGSSMVMETVLIFYLYSILVVLDTVVNCVFFKSCNVGSWTIEHGDHDNVGNYDYGNGSGHGYASLKSLEVP